MSTATAITSYLSLLFVPIGVGVVMHISYLEKNLYQVLGVVVIGTMLNRWDYCKINGIFKPLSSKKKEMNSVETLYRIWVYLQTEPLFWLTITIGAFLVGDYLYKKSNINPLGKSSCDFNFNRLWNFNHI